jgi:hypothetical protein|tara:strand:+ start:1359 stop:1958 length:600 start_codon:yes stop_codon:yes gene_type:complete
MPIGNTTLNYQSRSSFYEDWNKEETLPEVADIGQTYADIIRGETQDYMKDYGDFEEALIASRKDTSLIDAVPEDVARESQKAKEIAERNRQRYGYQQTAIERDETGRSEQRGEALNLAGGLTNARVAQKEQNYQTMAGLINIGSDSYSQNINSLSKASAGQTERMNAYKAAKGSHKASMISTGATLGSAAILAAFGFGF